MPRKQSITIALDANLISQLETMETYKTYITIENPDRVVLSNLPFQVGQRVEIILL